MMEPGTGSLSPVDKASPTMENKRMYMNWK